MSLVTTFYAGFYNGKVNESLWLGHRGLGLSVLGLRHDTLIVGKVTGDL